jgi:apolipoprotein N-acyltransferase
MLHTSPFQLEARDAILHFMHQGHTVYEATGDAPWWIVSAMLFVAAFVRNGARRSPLRL